MTRAEHLKEARRLCAVCDKLRGTPIEVHGHEGKMFLATSLNATVALAQLHLQLAMVANLIEFNEKT